MTLWNIRDGRNGGLEGDTKGMNAMGVDVALFQEGKLTGEFYTKNSSGYTIAATDTATSGQGGLALYWREDNARFEVEEVWKQHPNVMSFHLVTGLAHYFVVGCYILSKDLTALPHVLTAWQ